MHQNCQSQRRATCNELAISRRAFTGRLQGIKTEFVDSKPEHLDCEIAHLASDITFSPADEIQLAEIITEVKPEFLPN